MRTQSDAEQPTLLVMLERMRDGDERALERLRSLTGRASSASPWRYCATGMPLGAVKSHLRRALLVLQSRWSSSVESTASPSARAA